MRSHPFQKTVLAAAALAALAASAHAQTPFTPVDTAFGAITQHLIPSSPIQSAILIRGAFDTATNVNGVKALAKDVNDFTGYIPINGRSDSGYIIINNEQNVRDSVHGDGGGMTVVTAQFKNNTWSVVNSPAGRVRSVNFAPVGGTIANCGGMQTPWGTVLTAEEWGQTSNAAIHASGTGYRDTSDFTITQFNGQAVSKTVKRYQNLNWMVEVNPATAQVVKKHYAMGRFDHEGGTAMADGKTVYLTDDFTPSVFFKFVSDTAGNYTKGQLSFYQQSVDGNTGIWIPLPMNLDTLINARAEAIKRGATLFTRLEWSEYVDGKIYITETGNNNSGNAHRDGVRSGGRLARHQAERLAAKLAATPGADSSIIDYYGRILRFDIATGKMDVLLEGGAGTGGSVNHLASPDGLTSVNLDGKKYLVIQEDLIGVDQGRTSPAAVTANRATCEMYWLDLSIATPSVNDLKRLMVGPNGSELTGGRFTPDGKTMFVNIQHPASSNPAPYNTSYTLAVWGYAGVTGLNFDAPRFKGTGKTEVEVNPLSRIAYFSRVVDVEVFDTAGRRLERHKRVAQLDIQPLDAGNYFLRLDGKDVHKLVIQ